MKVSLVTRDISSQDVSALVALDQARFFRSRGDTVRIYPADPAGTAPEDVAELVTVMRLGDLISGREAHFRLSDLFVYHYSGHYGLLESIRGIERGLVIFYYHSLTSPSPSADDSVRETHARDLAGLGLAHYSDLCIVDSAGERDRLGQQYGYAADRIYVVIPAMQSRDVAQQVEVGQAESADADLLRYEADLGTIVDQAMGLTLPPMPSDLSSAFAQPPAEQLAASEYDDVAQREKGLHAAFQEAKMGADVAIHDYVVRSRVPLIGPLIAWTRRNLTSHLREPYLDPIVARQVAFNRSLLQWADRAMRFWRLERTTDISRLQSRIDELEAELEELRSHLIDENKTGCR